MKICFPFGSHTRWHDRGVVFLLRPLRVWFLLTTEREGGHRHTSHTHLFFYDSDGPSQCPPLHCPLCSASDESCKMKNAIVGKFLCFVFFPKKMFLSFFIFVALGLHSTPRKKECRLTCEALLCRRRFWAVFGKREIIKWFLRQVYYRWWHSVSDHME